MSIFTNAPARPATEAQRAYLRDLIVTHVVPPEASPMIARIGAGHPLTLTEASDLIATLKAAPTRYEAEAKRRAAELDNHRVFLWGGPGVDEPTVAARWDALLEPHFSIQREVTGDHWTGARLRIDRVLWPRFAWSNGSRRPIGFEIKTSQGRRNDAGQAADYANTRWHLAPPDSPSCEWDTHAPDDGLLLVGLHRSNRDDSRALAPLGAFAFVVDAVRDDRPVLSLYFNGARMWTDGQVVNNNWAPVRKVGAR